MWFPQVGLSLIITLVGVCEGGRVVLNGPALETSDLRQIDGYVAQALPIYPKGFQLLNSGSAGNRPIIVKMIDPERGSAPQPNPGYYTNLPAVIPRGLEGLASTSFVLGAPILNQQEAHQFAVVPPQLAQPSVRVENVAVSNDIIQGRSSGGPSHFHAPRGHNARNSVVEATAEFEASLPSELRNPFYSNQYTAASLARESLPTSGEQLVGEWDTTKIRENKIRDLLSGAGLI